MANESIPPRFEETMVIGTDLFVGQLTVQPVTICLFSIRLETRNSLRRPWKCLCKNQFHRAKIISFTARAYAGIMVCLKFNFQYIAWTPYYFFVDAEQLDLAEISLQNLFRATVITAITCYVYNHRASFYLLFEECSDKSKQCK